MNVIRLILVSFRAEWYLKMLLVFSDIFMITIYPAIRYAMKIMFRDKSTWRHMQTRSCAHLRPVRTCQTPVINTHCSRHRTQIHKLQCCAFLACYACLLFAPALYLYLLCLCSWCFLHVVFFPVADSSFGLIKPCCFFPLPHDPMCDRPSIVTAIRL